MRVIFWQQSMTFLADGPSQLESVVEAWALLPNDRTLIVAAATNAPAISVRELKKVVIISLL
jgi:hypothetical protein